MGGWIYLDLNNGGSDSYSATVDNPGGGRIITTGPSTTSSLAPRGSMTRGPRPSQNWVTVTMFGTLGNHLLSTELDAAPLGNGCSPASLRTTANFGTGSLGPAGGVFVCPPGTTLTNGTTSLCTGTTVNPIP